MRYLLRIVALMGVLCLLMATAQASLVDLEERFAPRHDNELWLLVDDRSSTLFVYRGHRELERMYPVSLGRAGAAPIRTRGDRRTPTGEFHIDRFNFESPFHIFMGLDYPTPWHARDALNAGVMSRAEYDDYFAYLRRHGRPPQDTILGGYIGIHGLGEGDPGIHQQFHWTQGCVAVTNEQIERLSQLVDIGTRVVIR
ncbi:L,D-transpeptidase family protein [Halomonas sp. H5]|uniref:L,D-transpeptidase family protein n=1 Tax=Halomonas sp. H5 TaxID=3423910 RepID=UPI003D366F07